MRYGLIREATFLLPPLEQRRILEALACDTIIHERNSGFEGARRITRLLFSLSSGDELAVQHLGVFLCSTGEVARHLRDLLEIGAHIVVASAPDQAVRLSPMPALVQALTLLADHESLRPNVPLARPPGRIGGGSRKPLSQYQIEYARKLHNQGASLRSIGQLFQVSPEDIWKLIAP